ncbi:MAG TPA: insulinase family protein, partial [Gemmatimonadales bacterium]|nr:insulinase family protein [Gemmatimonadales bacterium]
MTNGWIVRLSASVLCVYALSACASASQEREGGLAVRPAEQAVPQSLAEGVASDPLPFDPLVRRGRLENGLTWYIRPNSRPENRAELRLVVNAGSILEDSTQLGLAHVVEHMAFNGTEEFEKQEIVRYLESVGTRFGADLNAYTSFDETVYELTVPTDSAGLLQKGLHILAEWAHAVTFDSAEVERERPVVLEEWRVGQGAGARLRDIQFPVLFAGSAYAERLPIGTE